LIYRIGTEELKFYSQPIYGVDWDTNDDCVEILFTILSLDNIISLWEAMLLERKIFFLSKSKTILNQTCLALTSLLFPFKWNHVYIPVLPYKCKGCADAFVPLIMGICFNIDLEELPEDALVVNLETNKIVKNNEKIPKLNDKLNKKLEKYKYKYNNPVDVLKIQYCDEVFNYCDTTEGNDKFNTQEIRNIFFEYFIYIFANFEKHFIISKKKNNLGEIEPAIFNRDGFLKEHSSTDVILNFNLFSAKFIFI
jgi:DENN domain-containing protein 4